MRRKITVIYDQTAYTLVWLRTLVWAEKEFNRNGIEIDFIGSKAYIPKSLQKEPLLSDQIKEECNNRKLDIVFIAYHHDLGICTISEDERADLLIYLKKRCNVLVWLDTADSTGTCLFDVLPYVDFYMKKQMLVDLMRYEKPIWGGRIFCEYYHNLLGIEDKELDNIIFPVLSSEYMSKIRLSWNVGIGDQFTRTKVQRLMYRRTYAPTKFCSPEKSREYDAHYRGSAWGTLAGYQRGKLRELIINRNDINYPDPSTKVPYSEYIDEIKKSRTIISPFGWGEICTRDFEAFMYGAALIKPDMSHLVTFPEYYDEDKTYISLKWDFSNFNDIIDYIMTKEGKEHSKEIAIRAQECYKHSLSSKGKEEFVEHIINEIGI